MDARGDAWVAHGSYDTTTHTVGHLNTNGTHLGDVDLTFGLTNGFGPTGVLVDAAGKIWVANRWSNNAMRIDPNAGTIVLTTNVMAGVTNVVTNYVGQVDLAVDLGDGSMHAAPYNQAAAPYNYSDMTGFNNRVVNPGGQPLKGYWMVIDDSGQTNCFWRKVSWTDNLPLTNCAVKVLVRASNERMGLGGKPFLEVTNNAPFTGINGRYLEVRVALMRESATNNPVLYDLTLHGRSTAFEDWFLDDEVAFETDDATFVPLVIGPGPFAYQWYALYPWAYDWEALPGQTNATLTLTNLDSWDHTNRFGVEVRNATGESLFVGPALLWVEPLPITIPSSGAASRYPATIDVFGQPTNGLIRVEVWLDRLSHNRPQDLDILVVSPSGHKIILMSDAGGTNAVTDATLVFHGRTDNLASEYPPEQGPIPSDQESHYWSRNYGESETQVPGAPGPPYLEDLDAIQGANPNHGWSLYLYDDQTGATGALSGSWRLKLFFE